MKENRKLIRVNNRLNKSKDEFSSESRWEATLNYPLTLPKNAKIGLLDCDISLAEDYIVIENYISGDDNLPNFRILYDLIVDFDEYKKVYLLPGRYLIQLFKSMLEWSLNGAIDYKGTEVSNITTGLMFNVPAQAKGSQYLLSFQWKRSDPASSDISATTLNGIYDGETQTLTSNVLGVDDYCDCESNIFFTNGSGIMSCTLDSLVGLDTTEMVMEMGLKIPYYAYDLGGDDYLISIGVAPNDDEDGFTYKLSYYPTIAGSANNILNGHSDLDIPIRIYLTNEGNLVNEPLKLTIYALSNGLEVIPQEGDIIELISGTDENYDQSVGGYYYFRITRGEGTILIDQTFPKCNFIQYNMANIKSQIVNYLNPNTGNTIPLNLKYQGSLQLLQGVWRIFQSTQNLLDLKYTNNPYHIVDQDQGTELNLMGREIDVSQPTLGAIIGGTLVFDFPTDNLALNIFGFRRLEYVYIDSTIGELPAEKFIAIDGYRAVNILIDNIDLESYDTSIKDKENLLFCLTGSNSSGFLSNISNVNNDLLHYRFNCQNEPLMISLKNKNPVVMNKLKIRLTDTFYKTFRLSKSVETHMNLLITGEDE